jgi:hypothetical protein
MPQFILVARRLKNLRGEVQEGRKKLLNEKGKPGLEGARPLKLVT